MMANWDDPATRARYEWWADVVGIACVIVAIILGVVLLVGS